MTVRNLIHSYSIYYEVITLTIVNQCIAALIPVLVVAGLLLPLPEMPLLDQH